MLPPLSQSKKLPKMGGLASSQDLGDRQDHDAIFLKQMNNLWTEQSNKEVSPALSEFLTEQKDPKEGTKTEERLI